MNSKTVLSVSCFLLLSCLLQAQHEPTVEKISHKSMKQTHQLTLGLGHTHVTAGIQDGKRKWLPLASWSLNYDYWISNKWAIGLQNDWVMESFVIENSEGEFIERKNPISVVPIGMFKPGKHWSFVGGVGVELSSEKNFMLTRLGLEYGVHLPKNWEVGVALVWDNKWNYYNSWGLTFIASKLWPKKGHK